MENFDIDVSGGDLLSKNFTICIANKDSVIKGFKFSNELISVLTSRYGQGLYRYSKSKKGKSLFKLRLYCVAIFYLFKALKIDSEIALTICRDFSGNEQDIKESLKFLLIQKLGLPLGDRIYFARLCDSNAHKYAFLMRHDDKDKMKTYVKISLEEFEQWLKK